MKLSVSNIGWKKENNEKIFDILKKQKFSAIEIAPTILIPDSPYDKLKEAKKIIDNIRKNYNLSIASMQSIWYGKKENIFNSKDAKILINYTKKAIDFAKIIGCSNIVFGCPKNRIKPANFNDNDIIYFFKELGEYALLNNIVISIEPNPTIYGTNFINSTNEAFEFVKKIACEGIKVNVDFGTIIQNNENLKEIVKNINLINHIHISEPGLQKIKKRNEHQLFCSLLKENNYDKYVSIEMKYTEDINDLIETIEYVKEIFG